MAPAAQAAELAQLTGMKAKGPLVFGTFQGHPAFVHFYDSMNGGQVIFQLKVRPSLLPALAGALADSAMIQGVGLTPSAVRLDGDIAMLSYVVTPKLRAVKAPEALSTLQGLAALAQHAGPPLGTLCSTCENNPGMPLVINGRIYQLCRTCYDRLAAEFAQVRGIVASQKPNYRRGLLYGALGMLGAALIWALIGLATGYMIGLIAIFFGYLVAFGIQKGAGIVNNALIAAAVLLSILAAVIGFVFFVLFIMLKVGVPFSLLPQAMGLALANGGGDLGFGILMGIFGAWGAASQLRRAKGSQGVSFEVVS